MGAAHRMLTIVPCSASKGAGAFPVRYGPSSRKGAPHSAVAGDGLLHESVGDSVARLANRAIAVRTGSSPALPNGGTDRQVARGRT
jgi:hypothetical protein